MDGNITRELASLGHFSPCQLGSLSEVLPKPRPPDFTEWGIVVSANQHWTLARLGKFVRYRALIQVAAAF